MRVAVIGSGAMAVRHARILKSIAPSSFVTIGGASAERAKAASAAANVPSATIDESLDGSAQLVVIATRPSLHVELACAALRAGSDTAVEKPAARSLEEWQTLAATAEGCSQQLFVAENFQFLPLLNSAARHLQNGSIGSPLTLSVRACRANGPRDGWRVEPTEVHGALQEGGVHHVRFVHELLRAMDPNGWKPSSVLAYSPEAGLEDGGLDRTAVMTTSHLGGAQSHLLHSWDLHRGRRAAPYFRVEGTNGSMIGWMHGIVALRSARGWRLRGRLSRSDPGGYRAMWRAIVTAVQHERAWPLGLDDIGWDMSLVESAYASMRSRRVEDVLDPSSNRRTSGT